MSRYDTVQKIIREKIQRVGTSYLPKYKEKNSKQIEIVKLPNEFQPLWNGGDSIVKRHALSYLYKRGITDSDILKYNI